jgi:hypothetical protein
MTISKKTFSGSRDLVEEEVSEYLTREVRDEYAQIDVILEIIIQD